ncbi:RNA 2',3'-cyclic phosphodiesterase [Desulfovibrio sp. JC010]|uniref:RNA 2',3'-cyclic phosphodiesterase n=1 Tax=Desulfovibrio sp. JC010 TaxID=2593641 RepID=UPI0013D836F3|nr:RNA 2',3'-cyclic phosphodiesterase [Desulfovibrio sp. JC010]NDV26055.1 RNA 2',3'-cyclic phosphodiesterase [Desulfovibrio sp. JC010]
MKKIRTFIAHPGPQEWIKMIGSAHSNLREGLKSRISWVKPENMHFTLKFLGNVEEDRLTELDDVLQKIPVVNFKISSSGAGFFPSQDKPHIIWTGISSGTEQICSTAAAIDSSLEKIGFAPNRKSCHAHLTLGRVKKNGQDDWAALAEKINCFNLPDATISGFNLYKSVLTPEGPVYSVLKEYR